MPALARTEVPPARVAAQPRSVNLAGKFFGQCEPAPIKIEPFFKVDVEEMIGRRRPGRSPPANAVVKAAFQVSAILVEVNEFRIALLHPTGVYALGGDVEFTRNPDA